MNGTFNGITLSQITSLNTTTEASGFKRTTLRILGQTVPKLKQILQLNSPGLLITSSEEIQGKLVQYAADVHTGYEVTLEWKGFGLTRFKQRRQPFQPDCYCRFSNLPAPSIDRGQVVLRPYGSDEAVACTFVTGVSLANIEGRIR